jgi:hypothetical protein
MENKFFKTWAELTEDQKNTCRGELFGIGEEALEKWQYHFDGVKLSAICFNKWEEHFPYVITDFARDAALEEAWDDFADIPMDPETECMEEPFLFFKAGTNREEIWHWFDEHHSKGVYWLLYERGLKKRANTAFTVHSTSSSTKRSMSIIWRWSFHQMVSLSMPFLHILKF